MQLRQKISSFINRHHVLTVSTLSNQGPWAASLFYVFDEESISFIVMSDSSTRHTIEWQKNARVAGTISNQEANIIKLQGVQFVGSVRLLEHEERKKGKKLYTNRFPIAVLHSSSLWQIVIESIKFTDNTLGFGTKLYWNRPKS